MKKNLIEKIGRNSHKVNDGKKSFILEGDDFLHDIEKEGILDIYRDALSGKI